MGAAGPSSAMNPDRSGRHRQFGLRQIMVLMVYVAVLLGIARGVRDADDDVAWVVLAVMVGLGVAGAGLWMAMRLTRFAFAGWVLFVIGYMGTAIGTIQYLAIPSLPVLIGSIIYLNGRRRATNQDALLWVLGVAVERGMPLGPGVAAFSGQVAGMDRVWTGALARLLDGGVPLPEAIESVPRCVSAEARVLIRSGYEAGRLGGGIREAVESRRRRQPVMQAFGARVAYLCWVVFFSQAVVGFVLYFIMPKFEAILMDFGVELARSTTLLTGLSRIAANYGGYGLVAELLVAGYAAFLLMGGSNLNLPLVDRFFRRRHTILILRCLAVAVESGRPIGPALDSLARWYPTRWVARNLADAAAYARQGVEPIEALHGCELIGSGDRGVLDAARSVGNLAWALREVAETAERRAGYRLQAWSQVLFVLTVIGLGLVALLIAVGCFAPLVQIITRLSE